MTEVDARLLACESPKVPTGEDQGEYAEVLCNYESNEVRFVPNEKYMYRKNHASVTFSKHILFKHFLSPLTK